MKCKCRQLADYFEPHPDEEFQELISSLAHVEGSDKYELYMCVECNQYFAVEPYSRGPIVVKLSSADEFLKFDERPYRKLLFIDFHGGLSDRKCMFAGCDELSVNNLVFCVEHGFVLD